VVACSPSIPELRVKRGFDSDFDSDYDSHLGLRFAIRAPPGDNLEVEKHSIGSPVEVRTREPFVPGAIVIATLSNPREKFWGMILALAPEGLSLSGAELASFEDLAVMVRDGEPFTPAVVFFPMHRLERVELDLPDGSLPSLSQRFLGKTGLEPSAALAPSHGEQHNAGDELRDSASHASKERA
jgi:hypothetical protein